MIIIQRIRKEEETVLLQKVSFEEEAAGQLQEFSSEESSMKDKYYLNFMDAENREDYTSKF